MLQVRFYVLPVGTMEEHVVLGHTWCYLTNCQIDWHKKQAKMVYKGNATQVSLLHEDTSTQPLMPTSGNSTVDKGKGKQILTQNTSPTEASSSPQSTPTTSTAGPTHTTLPQDYVLFTQHDNINGDKMDSQEVATSSRIFQRRDRCMVTTTTSPSKANISFAIETPTTQG